MGKSIFKGLFKDFLSVHGNRDAVRFRAYGEIHQEDQFLALISVPEAAKRLGLVREELKSVEERGDLFT